MNKLMFFDQIDVSIQFAPYHHNKMDTDRGFIAAMINRDSMKSKPHNRSPIKRVFLR
jgi:hypothetical protein